MTGGGSDIALFKKGVDVVLSGEERQVGDAELVGEVRHGGVAADAYLKHRCKHLCLCTRDLELFGDEVVFGVGNVCRFLSVLLIHEGNAVVCDAAENHFKALRYCHILRIDRLHGCVCRGSSSKSTHILDLVYLLYRKAVPILQPKGDNLQSGPGPPGRADTSRDRFSGHRSCRPLHSHNTAETWSIRWNCS